MNAELPLVSCICPTRNRTRFVAKAIECFHAQDYPNKQLLIYEEESESFADTIVLPPKVIYLWSPKHIFKSLGEKRNAMCSLVDGGLIAHWDDDDWHAPNRLSAQVAAMQGSARLCGLNSLVFYNESAERAYLFQTVRKFWLAGGTLVYERSLWAEQPFDHVSNGEDVAFIDAAIKRGAKVASMAAPSLYVAMLHDSNTTTREIDSQWGHFDPAEVRRWMAKGDANART